MASLPPALDFSKMEEAICEKWDKEGAFQAQDRLAQERGDEVRGICVCVLVCIPLWIARHFPTLCGYVGTKLNLDGAE